MAKVTPRPPGASAEAFLAVAAVLARACPLCEAPAGQPCQPKPEGFHLARFLEAHIAGHLSKSYMCRTVSELVVIDECAVIAAPAVAVVPQQRPDGAR
jgi:hypothetical protein